MTTPIEPQTADLDRVLADGRPAIRCSCGFLAVSADQRLNLEALEAHWCPLAQDEDTEDDGGRWYHHVFSFWGWAALVVITSALAAIFGHGK